MQVWISLQKPNIALLTNDYWGYGLTEFTSSSSALTVTWYTWSSTPVLGHKVVTGARKCNSPKTKVGVGCSVNTSIYIYIYITVSIIKSPLLFWRLWRRVTSGVWGAKMRQVSGSYTNKEANHMVFAVYLFLLSRWLKARRENQTTKGSNIKINGVFFTSNSNKSEWKHFYCHFNDYLSERL